MVIAPIASLSRGPFVHVLILAGWIDFMGVRQVPGDIGPLSLDRPQIEWLE
jgi:hypothetical protein